MKFKELLLLNGAVERRYDLDTDALEPAALAVCAGMLRRLRAGDLEAGHNVSGIPDIAVSLGIPPYVEAFLGPELTERSRAVGRYYSVQPGAGTDPFSVNLVLPRTADAESDRYAVATMLGLSHLSPGVRRTEEVSEAVWEEVWDARPVSLVAYLPPALTHPGREYLIQLMSDFLTCFSAALLLEEGV